MLLTKKSPYSNQQAGLVPLWLLSALRKEGSHEVAVEEELWAVEIGQDGQGYLYYRNVEQ